MGFENSTYLNLLWIIAAMVILPLYYRLWQRKTLSKFASAPMLRRLAPDLSVRKYFIKFIVVALACVALVIALVNPRTSDSLKEVKREGVDIVFAVDVSKSMLAEDTAPSRLAKAKQLVNQILNNLATDRVGLIAYAGSAVPQLPITTDYSSARMFTAALDTDMVSSQGTAISQALELSKDYFAESRNTAKVLIIISDGEDHEGDVVEDATDLADQNIRIMTIGIGTAGGGKIPLRNGGRLEGYKTDAEGNEVITKLDRETLQEIAEAGRGKYISGQNTQQVIDELKNAFAGLDKAAFESAETASYTSYFQYFIGLALFLLLADSVVFNKKTFWVKRLNLFNESK